MGMFEMHQGWWDPKLCNSRSWGAREAGQLLCPIVLLHGELWGVSKPQIGSHISSTTCS